MDEELKKHLFDIKDFIESISQYLNNNLDFNVYKRNKIDDEIVWGVTIKHLPALKIEIENLLNS